jgi:hypothetical protein
MELLYLVSFPASFLLHQTKLAVLMRSVYSRLNEQLYVGNHFVICHTIVKTSTRHYKAERMEDPYYEHTKVRNLQ